MDGRPAGTVTFLFTDIEGSTRLLQDLGTTYRTVPETHRRIVRAAFTARGGHECGTEGDAFMVVFGRATEAVLAARDAQRALLAEPWPEGHAVRVRMGIHTGEAEPCDDGYVGLAVHEAHRVSSAAHGGQVLVSVTTADLVGSAVELRDLGVFRLKDVDRPQPLFQLVDPQLPDVFPPPRVPGVRTGNLPAPVSTFVGREQEIKEVRALLEVARLVTITGTGGAGKTRLATELAAGVHPPDGAWLVELGPVTDEQTIERAAGLALGLREADGTRPWHERLVDALRTKTLLIVLDNCEHLLSGCARLAQTVLSACPDVRILATSREPLGMAGETAWRIPSLDVPPDDLGDPSAHAAVQLFVERAREADPSFTDVPPPGATFASVTARVAIGAAASIQGDHVTGRSWLEGALAIARAARDAGSIILALYNLQYVMARLGEVAPARAMLTECVALADDASELWTGPLWSTLAWHELADGDLDRARGLASAAYDAAVAAGIVINEHRALTALVEVALREGSIAKAIGYARRTVEITDWIGDRRGLAWSRANLAETYLADDRPADALAVLATVVDDAKASGDDVLAADILLCEGEIHEAAADTRTAEDRYRRALDLYRACNARHGIALALENLAAVTGDAALAADAAEARAAAGTMDPPSWRRWLAVGREAASR